MTAWGSDGVTMPGNAESESELEAQAADDLGALLHEEDARHQLVHPPGVEPAVRIALARREIESGCNC
eukprot:269068-Rhodomonas_salina.2